MFLGHFALGFAARRFEPRVSLPWAFAAVQLADLAWPAFLLTGVEQVTIDPGNTVVTPLRFDSYPWSHSLLTLTLAGLAFGAVHFARQRSRRAAGLLAALVVSHWLLDFASHRPDLPLWPGRGAQRFGLGLWYSLPATLLVEGALFATGLALYLRATPGRSRARLWVLIAFFLVAYVGALFGPPPPDTTALASSALALWLLLPWAAYVERAS